MDTKVRRLCHDLKTERPDVGKPLPAVLRLLPIGAYFIAVAAVGLCLLLAWQLRAARDDRDVARSEEASHKAKQAQITAEAGAITAETKRAEEARKWIEGCESVQDLVVTVVRSMRPTSSLADISLVRDPADPKKIQMSLQISAGGPTQLDETLNQITTQLGYRQYFAVQKAEKGGEISYQCTLIKQARRETASTAATAPPPPIVPAGAQPVAAQPAALQPPAESTPR